MRAVLCDFFYVTVGLAFAALAGGVVIAGVWLLDQCVSGTFAWALAFPFLVTGAIYSGAAFFSYPGFLANMFGLSGRYDWPDYL